LSTKWPVLCGREVNDYQTVRKGDELVRWKMRTTGDRCTGRGCGRRPRTPRSRTIGANASSRTHASAGQRPESIRPLRKCAAAQAGRGHAGRRDTDAGGAHRQEALLQAKSTTQQRLERPPSPMNSDSPPK
jgi:hypothetical protein